MVSDEALKKLQEQIAAWPMERRFVVQQLIRDYLRDREDLRAYEATRLTPRGVEILKEEKLSSDGMILLAFLLGFPANEIVLPILLMGYSSAGTLVDGASLAELKTMLLANGWTGTTALCMLLFSLFHFPCGTTTLTLARESKSLKWTLVGVALPTAVGMTVCFAVHLAATWLKI